ncbi:MAG: DUF4982 domain-containing protein [Chitinispirillaceae bacterium]|nr:DUF4982 domain-containing protein [Chitinispirillaceae bacterium]
MVKTGRRRHPVRIVLWCAVPLLWVNAASGGSAREEIPLNNNWLYLPYDSAGASLPGFDESKCSSVCLPHTNNVVRHNDIDTSAFAFVSWYRRHLALPAGYEGRRLIVEFEAVSKVALVFVNGRRIGEHCGAYTPFSFDITDAVTVGGDNVIAVRVDSRQRRDVPPEGKNVDYMVFGGIVRDVYLTVVDPLHVERVYARRDTGKKTRLILETTLANDGSRKRRCMVTAQLVDANGGVVAQAAALRTVDAHARQVFRSLVAPAEEPRAWHPDSPYLYTVRTIVADSGAQQVDTHAFRTGVRTFAFDKTGAFTVNGLPLKLRGLNRHETFPFVGRAAANRLQARDADIIRYDFGCTMVRCSHYPQDPAFLDRCDEIGLLVLEEMAGWVYVAEDSAWQERALGNLKEMIVRDRNRPSIVSFGVRINQSADFHDFYAATNRLARRLDPSRPTHGARVLDRGSPEEFLEGIWAQNFKIPGAAPSPLPWITTESVGHHLSARSWDSAQRLLDHALAHAAAHDSAAAHTRLAGLLGWCAFDYNSPYRYAQRSVCHHGVADLFRIPKPAAYVYQSQRDPGRYRAMVRVLHDWSEALSPNSVWVASNCDSVELFVNGASLGTQAPSEFLNLERPLFRWYNVPFKRGSIRAVGYIRDSAVATHLQTSPKSPARLSVMADDTVLFAGGDMTRVTVTMLDANNQLLPRRSDQVYITVTGAADFRGMSPIALDNGATAFFVQTRARDTGLVRCRARADGLGEAETLVAVRAATDKEF